jgi:hypothetical protein
MSQSKQPKVFLWYEKDMTGVPKLIDPHCETWTGGPQRFVIHKPRR